MRTLTDLGTSDYVWPFASIVTRASYAAPLMPTAPHRWCLDHVCMGQRRVYRPV
jgi:hypothetical protein